LENLIRFRIDLVKNRIQGLEKECRSATCPEHKAFIRGRLIGAKSELNTLEDMLRGWEEVQKFGEAIPY